MYFDVFIYYVAVIGNKFVVLNYGKIVPIYIYIGEYRTMVVYNVMEWTSKN